MSACPVPHADGSRLSGELYAARLTGFSQRPAWSISCAPRTRPPPTRFPRSRCRDIEMTAA
ncbi:hypothetical protein BGLA2_990007 [Burkholderia gladioli]|nr:hypothetical protein BGLA2_990007 [Burkholderia gladioli]